MRIYSTLSGQLETLERARKTVKFFTCGPTVYDYIHIGNARTYVSFDIIVRYLQARGHKVFYLQNITDIDDKIIKRATTDKTTAIRVASFFTRAYRKDMRVLQVDSVSEYAPATKFIPQIVKQVQTLIRKGYAYRIDDGYYYDISRFEDYGKLARRTVEQAEDGVSRIDENTNKRNRGDFCLWKFFKPGEPFWNTPLGKGRPGWHIEDTAITEHFFGPQYDIHGGGTDLKFPHHEAEIAQQEAASGKKPFVKVWMHAGMIRVGGRKMSKSLGNFITLRDFLKQHSPVLFRWIVLKHHYRSEIDFTDETVSQAKQSLCSLFDFAAKVEFALPHAPLRRSSVDAPFFLKHFESGFYEAMDDDFNTPKAVGVLFDAMNIAHTRLWTLRASELRSILQFFTKVFELFAIPSGHFTISLKVQRMSEQRELSRGSKQFIQSDELREKIKALGYSIEDTPYGPFIRPLSYFS